MDFFINHPYLIGNIPVLIFILVAVKVVQPRQYRWLCVLSGLICLPFAFLDLQYNQAYWTAIRVGGWPIGIEDFIFTFVSGAMVWMLAAWSYRIHINMNDRLFFWGIRYLWITLLFCGFGFLLERSGVKIIENTLITGAVTFLVLLFLRRALWFLAVRGVMLFLPVYILIVKVQFSLLPDYLSQWNLKGVLGVTFMGIPMGEFAWAIVFAAVWPLYVAFVFDVNCEIPAMRPFTISRFKMSPFKTILSEKLGIRSSSKWT